MRLGVCRRASRLYPRGTIRATRPFAHPPSHNYLHRSNTDMDVRDSFSRLKKKVKRIGGKLKPNRAGADTDGESIDPANPLPQPESHFVTGPGEGNGPDTDGRQACSTDRLPQPDEPETVVVSGSDDGRGGGDAGVAGGRGSTECSHPHPDVEAGAGSDVGQVGDGTDGEGDEQFYSCSSAPSTPRSMEPDGM